MEQLQEISHRLLRNVETNFVRSLEKKIQWQNRLIEIKGARGVGKTTLMLQRAKELSDKGSKVLYVSADHAYFFSNKLIDLADKFYKYGGQYLFIDEVHKYPKKEKGLDWSQEIKNIYDAYPQLFIVYSGSSILQLYKGTGDLSRRKSAYKLAGLSFREYLLMNRYLDIEAFTLEDIIKNHTSIANDLNQQIKILPLFSDYLANGYYPFYQEASDSYFQRLQETINVIMETDIPAVSDITFETSLKLKTLLAMLAVSVPYTPNLTKLMAQLHITDNRTLLRYLNFLDKAELITILGAEAIGNQIFNKPDKLYLNNTNLMYSFGLEPINKGTLRETFACNQLKQMHKLSYPKQTDFSVDGKILIEIGGKNKKKTQISGFSNAYVLLDDIEIGLGNTIPLWLLGFLY